MLVDRAAPMYGKCIALVLMPVMRAAGSVIGLVAVAELLRLPGCCGGRAESAEVRC